MADDLDQKIIKQLEYYFGDYNLPRDKFLKEKVNENEGWVDLSVLLTFKRLATLSTDTEVILKALEKSKNGVIAISEDRTKIRRVPEKPIPELDDERRKELTERTAYAKGFPLDESLDDIITYLEQQGNLESCMKRSYLDKATNEHKFKGSCFIVFGNAEDCKKFIDAESVKYKDIELIRKWQSAYFDEKRNDMRTAKYEKKNKTAPEGETKKLTYPKGAFLHFSGIATDKVLTREEIKEKFTEVSETEPAYIDFKRGDVEGYIRMSDENGAIEFHKKLTDGILEAGETKLQFRVLEGEEEESYLKKTIESVSTRRHHQKHNTRAHKRKGNNSDASRGGNKRSRHSKS